MSRTWKIGIVAALMVAVAGVLAHKHLSGRGAAPEVQAGDETPATGPAGTLPKIMDFGMGKCKMCKAMIPIMAELKAEYAGRLDVELVDVKEREDLAETYDIRVIPTQVFLDSAGNELSRHEGFMPKENILAEWQRLGVDLGGPDEPKGQAHP